MVTRSRRLFALIILFALTACVALPTSNLATAQDNNPSASDLGGLDKRTPKNMEELKRLEQGVMALVNKVRPAVVGLFIGQAGGSGTFISEDGFVITAAHVTTGAGKNCKVYMSDGTALNGKTLGLNRQQDYALIKADVGSRKVPFVALGDSQKITPGQWVVSMGHPLGTETSPFRPPVVRVGRVAANGSQAGNFGHIVADAPLISGDSGGPMFELGGAQIGINVSIDTTRVTINNAVPVNFPKAAMARLKASENFGGGGSSLADYDQAIQDAYTKLDAEQFEAAETAFKALIASTPDRSEAYYHLACCYIRWMKKLSGDAAAAMRKNVFDTLNKAVSKGWDNLDHMTQDTDMNDVRESAEFRAVVIAIRRKLGHKPYLGLSTVKDAQGVVVESVGDRTAAAWAGLKAGDQIVEFDGKALKTRDDLTAALEGKRPGDVIKAKVMRAGSAMALEITLGGREDTAGRGPMESKDGPAVRNLLNEMCKPTSQAMAQIVAGTKAIGFGLIVREDGIVLCKNSDLGSGTTLASIKVRLPGGGDAVAATRVASYDAMDLALLKVSGAKGLSVVQLAENVDTKIGNFVFSVGTEAVPFSIGVRSLAEYRTMRAQDTPFLGVGGETISDAESQDLGIDGGMQITSVQPRSGAEQAGLRMGDVLYKIGEAKITSVETLREFIMKRRVGDTVELKVFRNGEALTLRATLGRQPSMGAGGGGNPFMNQVRGPFSKRDSGFGEVVQHDCLVLPVQCGSALVDITGKVIGMNIARSDRTKSYALPAPAIRQILPELFKQAKQAESGTEDF